MKKTIRNRFQTAKIFGRLANEIEEKINNLRLNKRNLTNDDLAQIREWNKKADEFRDEQSRYNLQGRVCGLAYTAIR